MERQRDNFSGTKARQLIGVPVLLVFLWAPLVADAANPPSSLEESFGAGRSSRKSWAHFQTYVPQERDYFIDIGSMWENRNMYWAGGQMGFHVGRCVFSGSQTCQQYLDLVMGIAGSDGLTMGVALAGVRWQFVNFPATVSPSISLYAGLENLHDSRRNKEALTWGAGYGITASVHERMDLKFEVRVGYGAQEAIWSQAFVSLGLKMDKWVDYFAHKLRSLGEGTAEVTGKAIKKTFETSVDVMDTVITQPVKKAVETTGDVLGVTDSEKEKKKNSEGKKGGDKNKSDSSSPESSKSPEPSTPETSP